MYLYYNPHAENKVIDYYSEEKVDLFDIVTKKYIARGKSGSFEIELPGIECQCNCRVTFGDEITVG